MFLRNKENREEQLTAIIVAAGRGERLAMSRAGRDSRGTMDFSHGYPQGKALVNVLDVPMITHSLLAFEAAARVGQIVVVAREIDILGIYDVVKKLGLRKVENIVKGGETRQESVSFGLDAIIEGRGCSKYVAIHDCARPCISSERIDEIVEYILTTGNSATFGVRVSDTLKRVQGGVVVEDVSRVNLWQIQTPQVFNTNKLRKAHEKAMYDGYEATDDAALLQNFGEKVHVLESDAENIKISTVADLFMAERILEER